MSRYRRPKHLSSYGSISGVELNHFRPGLKAFSAHSDAGQGHLHFEQYDPIRPRYEWSEPDYQEPPSWFDGVVAQPPLPERIAGHWNVSEERVRYEQSLVQPWMIEQIMLEVMARASLAAGSDSPRPDSETSSWDVDQAGQEAGQTQVSQQQSWDESIGTEPPSAYLDLSQVVDALFVPEMGMKSAALLSEAQSAYEQQTGQGLEALVEDAIQDSTPSQMQEDPFEIERRLYDQQMQQMLNPFLMPGFGPGT